MYICIHTYIYPCISIYLSRASVKWSRSYITITKLTITKLIIIIITIIIIICITIITTITTTKQHPTRQWQRGKRGS